MTSGFSFWKFIRLLFMFPVHSSLMREDMIWPSLCCFKVYPLSSNLCYSKIFTDDNNYSFDISMVYIFLSKHSWGLRIHILIFTLYLESKSKQVRDENGKYIKLFTISHVIFSWRILKTCLRITICR